MSKIQGLFRLLRFELPISAGICVLMGQLLALGTFPSLLEISNGFLSIFFISAAILVLNDYFDVESDKINSPDRPIPSNLVTTKEALLFSILLFIIGLLLSYFICYITFICAVILSIIGILYNSKFKKHGLVGNLMVSFSVGMTFIYGGISVGLPFNKVVLFFAVIAALIDLGEEIAADSMDAEGDLLINSKSLAIQYGRQFSLKISASIFLFVIMFSLFPFILNWLPKIYLIPILIMDTAIGVSTLKLLKSKNDEGRKYIRQIYLGATFGLLTFIIMRFIGI